MEALVLLGRCYKGALPIFWSATGLRSQRSGTGTSVQYFEQFSPSNALQTGSFPLRFRFSCLGNKPIRCDQAPNPAFFRLAICTICLLQVTALMAAIGRFQKGEEIFFAKV